MNSSKGLATCPVCDAEELHTVTVFHHAGGLRPVRGCCVCGTCFNEYAFSTLRNRRQEEIQIVDYVSELEVSGMSLRKRLSENARLFRGIEQIFGVRLSGEKAIDFGCGLGVSSIYLSRRYESINAVDFTTEGVRYLCRCLPKRASKVIPSADVQFDDVDLIFSWHVLEHLSEPTKVLDFLLGRLKPGGILMAQVPMLREQYMIDEHFCFYTERFLEYFRRRFPKYSIASVIDVDNSFLTLCVKKEDA